MVYSIAPRTNAAWRTLSLLLYWSTSFELGFCSCLLPARHGGSISSRREMAAELSGGGRLVDMCIEAASDSCESVERWRRQRRTLERMPSHLADALFRRLLSRGLLSPSLLEVFQHSIEEIDLSGESFVDAEWLAYLGSFHYLRTLNIAGCRNVTNHALWSLTGMTCLKELDLSRCSKLNDAGIEHLLSILNLRKLSLSKTGVSAEGVMCLSSLRNLRILDLGGLPVTDQALFSLQDLSQVEYLDLWGSRISNEGVAVLKKFRHLTSLNLYWTSVTKLPTLQSLKCLNMGNCTIELIFEDDAARTSLSQLLLPGATFLDVHEAFIYLHLGDLVFLDISGSSVEDFFFLRNMPHLEHLDLSFSRMTNNQLDSVSCIGNNLRNLNLSNTRVTSQGVAILAGCVPSLETLLLSHTAVDDVALPYISLMPSLKAIVLSNTSVRGFIYQGSHGLDITYSLTALQSLARLEILDLKNTQVRDEALEPLSYFGELSHLCLKSDFLSDISLNALSEISKLKKLEIRGAVLTDAGLLSFKPPTMLHVLDLKECWLLTEDAILTFSKHYPQIDVRHELMKHASVDKNVLAKSSPLRATTKPSKLKVQRGSKLSQAAGENQEAKKYAIQDERRKYSRKELLNLQFAGFSLRNMNFTLPELLVEKIHE